MNRPFDEMVQAIRDWVKSWLKKLEEKMRKLEEKTDPDTILRKTGDAGNVTVNFSKYGSRTLPASGEKLEITLGKIMKYLSDLNGVAFSSDYRDLSFYKCPIGYSRHLYSFSASAAFVEELLINKAVDSVGGEWIGIQSDPLPDNVIIPAWLIIGYGGPAFTNATPNYSGNTDFARAYLVVGKMESEIAAVGAGRSFLLLQLGSVGSTQRFTVTATAGTSTSQEYVKLTIPKGSYASVFIYEMHY